jgi:hypothetical protein
MFRPLISMIRAFVLFAMLTLNLGVAFGRNDASKTYRCTAKDAVSLQDNGTVDRDSIAKAYRKNLDGIIINTLTGALTYASGSQDIWRVVQEGNSANDHVLIPRIFFQEANKAAATAATDFIRVRAWSGQPHVTFMAFSLSVLVTGTCEIAR